MILRGIVKDNNDPEILGRIKVQFLGDLYETPTENLSWIYPLEVFAGNVDSGSYVVPDIGTAVFILQEEEAFENMLYFGSWNIQTDKILDATKPSVRVLYKSTKGHTILIDDTPGDEKFKIIDRLGQSIEFFCPAEEDTENRGIKLASEGNGIDAGKEAGIKMTTVDGSGIVITSKGGKTNIVVNTGDGQVTLNCKKVQINEGGAKVLTDKIVPFCYYTGRPFTGSSELEVSP